MKQLTAMLSRSADGAMLVDEDGKVVFWNRAAERLLGFHAEEVVGRPCHDVLRGETLSGHPLCSATCQIGKRVASGRAVRNFDMQARTKAGRMVWLNVSSLPVSTRKPGQFWAAHLFRDITKQAKVRQLADELHTALCSVSSEGPELHPEPPSEIMAALPLSARERDVLRELSLGKDTKDIAESLCISPATVRNHIQHILEKLGAHNRLQALAIASRPRE
jgi:PAS domain S-box-containing protein